MHTRSLPKLLCCLAVLAVTRMPGATAQYTAHQERYLMDPGWRFTLGDPPGAESARYHGDTAWTPVNLPDDWSIRGTWSRDNPSGSAGG